MVGSIKARFDKRPDFWVRLFLFGGIGVGLGVEFGVGLGAAPWMGWVGF